MERARIPLILLGFTVLQLLMFWPFFSAPIHGDPGVYAYAADRMLQGDVLYRDVWDVKPPGIFLQFCFAFAIFGRGELAAYLVDWLLALGCGLALFQIGRKLSGLLCGAFAALSWGALYLRFFYAGWYGQPETACVLAALLLANLALAPSALNLSRRILVGLLLAVLFWFKLPLLLFAAVLFLRVKREDLRKFPRSARLCWPVVAGFALPSLAILAYFAVNRAMGDLYQAILVLPPSLAAITRPPVSWQVSHFGLGLWELVRWSPVVLALSVLGCCSLVRQRNSRPLLPVLLLLLGLAVVALQARYFEYHWLAVLPGITLFAGFGATRLFQLLPDAAPARTVLVLLLIPSLYIGSYTAIWFFGSGYLNSKTKQEYWKWLPSNFGSDRHRLGADIGPTLAFWLKRPIPPDGYLLAFDLDGALNFYSQRRAPSRFLYLWHLKSRTFQEMGWTQEFADAVIRNRPRAIIVCRETRTPWGIRDDLPVLLNWPRLGEWFLQNYILAPSYSYPPQGKRILETYRLKDLE